MVGSLARVICRMCPTVIVYRGHPSDDYEQLVLTMRAPNGAINTHELLVCAPCRASIFAAKLSPAALDCLYQYDVNLMIKAHTEARGMMQPDIEAFAKYMKNSRVVALRDEVGSSVAMLRARGILKAVA